VRLLIVTDGSCPAEDLRPVLAMLPQPTRVTLLAVAEPPFAGLGPPEDVLDPSPTRLPAALTDRLTALAIDDGQRACDALLDLFDGEVEVASECGDLARLLVEYVPRSAADLVVVAGWREHQQLRCAAVTAAQQHGNRPVLLTP
jgi:hypothetical protein